MKPKRIVCLVLAVLLTALWAAPALGSGGAADRVEELRVAIHTDENTLTPFTYVRGYPGLEVVRLIFDSLFTLDRENLPQPWMVEGDFEVDQEYKEYKMTLVPGQFWHDGQPVNAEDVAFSFTYPLDQNSTRWRRIAAQVESVEVDDELNFTLRLKAGNPDFLSQALTDRPIIPKHIYEEVEDASAFSGTIGSGPYSLAEYREGQNYILQAAENYFLGEPRVTRIVMPIMADTTTIFQALKAGSIHAATPNVAPELVSGFDAERDITVVAGPGLTTTLLQINNEVYPLSLVDMRKALALAIDTEDLVDVLLLGYGDRGSLGFFHPRGVFGTESLVPRRDLEKANQLLDGLGFSWQGDYRVDDRGQPLAFELLVGSNNPLRIRTAELIAEQVKEAGIQLNTISLEPNSLDDRVWPGFDVSKGRNYDLSMWGWSAPVQLRPDALVQLAASDHSLGTLNIGGFSGSGFDTLVSRYTGSIDANVRLGLIADMQEEFAAQVPLVPLYYPQVIMAYRADAYDGWVLQQGNGIINKMSFLPGLSAAPGAPGEEDRREPSEERNSLPFYLLALVLAAGAIVAARRKKGHAK